MNKLQGKKPHPHLEPLALAPDPPDWLLPEARRAWDEVVPHLEGLGLLSVVDGPSLAIALTHYGVACSAAAELQRDGVTEEDRAHGGQLKKHPAAQVFKDNAAAFRQWVAELGLSPAARQGLPLQEPADEGMAAMLRALDG